MATDDSILWRAQRLVDGGSATDDLLIENAGLRAALSAALARAEAAERLAVWAVRHGAFIDCEIPDVQAVFAFWPDERFEGEPDMDLCENTDADLLRALKQASDAAMGGGEGEA